MLLNLLRAEVRGNFNIHGTKYFYNAVFHQKSKKYDVVSLPLPLVGQKNRPPAMKYRHGWLLLLLKTPSEGIFSNNQLFQRFMERTGFLANQRYKKSYNTIFFKFLMENSILKIFSSVDVKIVPDFCS